MVIVMTPGGRVVRHFPTSIPPRSNRYFHILELLAEDHVTLGINHGQPVQPDQAILLGLFIPEVVRVQHPQGFGPGGQRHRPDQRLPVLPGFGLDGLSRHLAFLVEFVQGIHAAPLVLVVSHVAVVLERPGHRIEDAVAHRAGRIAHRRVVGVRQRHRVSGARGRFLHVEFEEVVVGPARPRPIAVGGRRGVTLEERIRVENAGVWIIRVERAGIKDAAYLKDRIEFILESVAHPVVVPDPRRPELVYVIGTVEAGGRAVGSGRPRVRHDVVGSEDLRVRQVVFHHVRNQLQWRASCAVLHSIVPIIVISIQEGAACRRATIRLVHEINQVAKPVEDFCVRPIRQQPVVARPQQELVKLRPRHQPPNGGAQHRRAPGLNRSILRVRRDAAREAAPPTAASCAATPCVPCRTASPASAAPARSARPTDPAAAPCWQSAPTPRAPARRRRAPPPESCSRCSFRRRSLVFVSVAAPAAHFDMQALD